MWLLANRRAIKSTDTQIFTLHFFIPNYPFYPIFGRPTIIKSAKPALIGRRKTDTAKTAFYRTTLVPVIIASVIRAAITGFR